jgi:gluconate 2-dehydrogenase gamma chain
MDDEGKARRTVLRGLATSLGVAALPWAEMARAAHDAHAAMQTPDTSTYTLFNATDAADVEALTSQIVPGGATPGAREAGVTFFIDRALSSFFSHWRLGFLDGLQKFQATCRAQCPQAARFAVLSDENQVEFLRTVDTTSFFDQARLLTLCGMFSSQKYGGNRAGAGWKLIGFEDQHVFEPPFGYYDRDYPGFTAQPEKGS